MCGNVSVSNDRKLRHESNHLRTALGFLVTLYATLITLFGLAWVLFLIGMICTRVTCSFRKAG